MGPMKTASFSNVQDLCLLEAPDVLWPEDFDPHRHAEVVILVGDVDDCRSGGNLWFFNEWFGRGCSNQSK